jgi:hypothetical protein
VKRLDPKKAPREMEWVRSAGPGARRTMQAIYEFDGMETYKVCFDPAGKGRPKELATTSGGCKHDGHAPDVSTATDLTTLVSFPAWAEPSGALRPLESVIQAPDSSFLSASASLFSPCAAWSCSC